MAVPARKVRQLPGDGPSRRPHRPAAPGGTPSGRSSAVPARHRAGPVRRPAVRKQPAPRIARSQRRAPFALFSLSVVTAMIVGLASAQAMVAQEAFRVADLTRSVERLEESHGRLRLKVAEMTSPGRLVHAARRAGLMLPDRVEIIEIDPARPGPGTGGTDEGAGGVLIQGPHEGSGPVLAQGPGVGEPGG